MTGKELLKQYVDTFNKNDEEAYIQHVSNAEAYDFLADRIPLFECPDKDIEETYYFRFWTLRKHIKHTEECGFVFTEFLYHVPWGGKYNTIVCAVGHHLNEARWLADAPTYVEPYAAHFLEKKRNPHQYSSWLISALYDYCRIRGDFSFALDRFEQLEEYYAQWESTNLTKSGLFFSIDGFDGMEFSISGTPTETMKRQPGLRPTLNSYMYHDALTLAKLADMKGLADKAKMYREKAEALRERIEERLWDGEFYKAIHAEDIDSVYDTRDIKPERNVRELLGYIPFIYGLGDRERAKKMFPLLTDPKVFLAKTGLTTADQGHPRFMYEADHECLWNGYVWPFATTQTLDACAAVMNRYGNEIMSNEDFTMLLSQYAKMHHRVREDGTLVNWIDEEMHPDRMEWSTREWLHSDKFEPKYGAPDRGKDYNHSTFCDLVIHDLVGVDVEDGKLVLRPHIPADWDYIRLENVTVCGKTYDITYDKTGEKYGHGRGWTVREIG